VGEWRNSSVILNLSTLHASAALPPGTNRTVSRCGRLEGGHSRSGHYGEETHTLSLPGIEPDSSSFQSLGLRSVQPRTKVILFSAALISPTFTVFSSLFIVDVDPAVEFLDDMGYLADVSEVHTASVILIVS
jgi:hypothetical protein